MDVDSIDEHQPLTRLKRAGWSMSTKKRAGWSTSTKKSAVVDVDGTFHDQFYQLLTIHQGVHISYFNPNAG